MASGPSLGEGKWQISKDGGTLPKWRQDGKEIIFRSLSRSPMAVDVSGDGSAFQVGVPKQLFTAPVTVGDWDVTGDGKRILMAVSGGQSTEEITVMLNWQAALKR